MREEHIFKNYSPGEPSVRLYLKNLAKQVEEKVSVCSEEKGYMPVYLYCM